MATMGLTIELNVKGAHRPMQTNTFAGGVHVDALEVRVFVVKGVPYIAALTLLVEQVAVKGAPTGPHAIPAVIVFFKDCTGIRKGYALSFYHFVRN